MIVRNYAILVGVVLTSLAAADSGDDFSNNLFSDLGPLLALIGERPTMQFMRQSIGWADNFVLAMVPIGIVTIIVAAIRVGGPPRLKAIIGRAMESRAAVEVELMSSTSNEVCELWNGQDVSVNKTDSAGPRSTHENIGQGVSVMELGDPNNTYFTKYEPCLRERVFGTFVAQDAEKAVLIHDTNRSSSGSRDYHQGDIAKRENTPEGPVVIVRNTVDTAPNLTFNVYNALSRAEVYLVAITGVTLQIGVLVYCGFITYYPTLMFLKDGDPVANYAYPCMATGTLALVTGLLICAHVVENSTSETTYRSAAGKEARIVWLQKSETVNDQAFESFAVFPQVAQSIVMTSQREEKLSSKSEELKAVIGTAISVSGYVVQFVGLRGLHWSASLALLIAISIMAGLRALIRRNLAKIPKAQPLLAGHEMDWLAMTLGGDFKNAPWPWAKGKDGWDWEVDSAVCEKLRESQKQDPESEQGSESKPYRVMRIRRNLSKLADWYGPASAEAISLARAIEITMDTLYMKSSVQDLSWCISVSGAPIKFRLILQENGNWKAYADELESALSLWLYSVRNKEQGIEQQSESDKNSGKDDIMMESSGLPHRKGNTDDDAWLRAKGTPAKRSLRILDSSTSRLRQDLRWWMPSGAARVLELEEYASAEDVGTIVVETHRVVGHQPNRGANPPKGTQTRQFRVTVSSDSPEEDSLGKQAGENETTGVILASESYATLETLFAQHLFSVFMWATAKTVEEVVASGAVVRPLELEGENDNLAWRSFTLNNARLSKLAQDIESTGLGSLEEVYMSIIPPLSSVKKLPGSEAIIEWARKHTKPHAQLGHWREELPQTGWDLH
ncbi:hypothetical protein HD806DRAFT_523893 [Xylariaceae sp. AK1471]|nr:hypothetical protein HD806DRAFT_523893 [Xylariaceae sp. AK1471]